MKTQKEQFGNELGPKDPESYQEYFELADQRPTFGEVNKTGRKNAGHDRKWPGPPPLNGDPEENADPVPISGGADGNAPFPKTRSQYQVLLDGKKYSPEFGRVPDACPAGEWKHTIPTEMYPNQGGTLLPTERRPMEKQIQLGWKSRGYDLSEDASAAAPSIVGPGISQTPQRKKLRKTEG